MYYFTGYIFRGLIFERDISSGTIDLALAVNSHITGTSLSRCLPHIHLCDITLEVFYFFFPHSREKMRRSLPVLNLLHAAICVLLPDSTLDLFIEFLVCKQISLIISYKDTSVLRGGYLAVVIRWRQAGEQKAGQVV